MCSVKDETTVCKGQRVYASEAEPSRDYCGAKTRKGTPCKSKVLCHSGRCKLHGGLSTGPKTVQGKEASRRNGKKGGRPKKNLTP